jgi:hypothetical protein
MTDRIIKPLDSHRHDQIIQLVAQDSCFTASVVQELLDEIQRLRDLGLKYLTERPILTVWEGPMPESNGKSNFTAILMRKGGGTFLQEMTNGFTIARSEYPDRVRYEADCVRWLIGELAEEPDMLAYDADKHSGYVAPPPATSTLTTKIDKYKSREQP